MYCSNADGDDCRYEDDLIRTGLPVIKLYVLKVFCCILKLTWRFFFEYDLSARFSTDQKFFPLKVVSEQVKRKKTSVLYRSWLNWVDFFLQYPAFAPDTRNF